MMRVDFADVSKKLIAQTFARAGAFHETGDVDEFENGRHEFLGLAHFSQHIQTFVRNGHNTGIRVDGAEPVISGKGFSGLGHCVE